MTDIVERLRKLKYAACDGAADEVERLQALRADEAKVYHDTQWRQLQEAQTEIGRLRSLTSDCPVCSDLERLKSK